MTKSDLKHIVEENKNLKCKLFDLYTILELSYGLSSQVELESLLADFLSVTINQAAAAGGLILVFQDSKPRCLMQTEDLSIPKNFKLEEMKNKRLPETLPDNQRFFSLDELKKKLQFSGPEYKILEGCRLFAVLPGKREVLGLVGLSFKEEVKDFLSADKKEFLTILCGQMAVILQNALLYESQKKAHLELLEAQKRMGDLEKKASLGQMAAQIAHEINNPLGIIRNYLTIISNHKKKHKTDHNYLKIIKEEVDRISKITGQLLDYRHTVAEKPLKISLIKLLDDTLNLFREDFKNKKIALVRNYAPGLPKVKIYPQQLKQVFLNLIKNALDFTFQKGSITVTVFKEKNFLKLEIADSGCGIPKENLDKIFQPFFSTRRDKGGAGLGLSVCKKIIEKHKGHLEVQSQMGKGSCFTVSLPLD